MRPDPVNISYQLHVIIKVVLARHVVRWVIVVCADVYDHQVGRLLRFEVPFRGLVAVDFHRPGRGVGSSVPLIYLLTKQRRIRWRSGIPGPWGCPSILDHVGRYLGRPATVSCDI